MAIILNCGNGKKTSTPIEMSTDGSTVCMGVLGSNLVLMSDRASPVIWHSAGETYDNGYAFGKDESRTQSVFEFPCKMASSYALSGVVFRCLKAGVTLSMSARNAVSESRIFIDADSMTTEEGKNIFLLKNRCLFMEGDEVIFRAEFSEPVTMDGSMIDNEVMPEKYGLLNFVPFFENIMEDIIIKRIPTEEDFANLVARVENLERA